eukprot:546788_1
MTTKQKKHNRKCYFLFICIMISFSFFHFFSASYMIQSNLWSIPIYVDRLYGNLQSASNHTTWRRYRLGDMVQLDRDMRWQGHQYHKLFYPTSIATEYIERTNEKKDYETMLQIINNRTLDALPSNDSLVVHLRTGDVIDLSKYSVAELLSSQHLYRGHKYSRPLSFYQYVLNKLAILHTNVSDVILVTGFHFNQNHEKSMQYIAGIKQFFETNGYNTALRMTDPDSDFLFMCNSKYFVKSGQSTYSSLTARMVEMKGGIVLKR